MSWFRTIATNALVLVLVASVSLGATLDECSPEPSDRPPCCGSGECGLGADPADTDLGAALDSTCTAVCSTGATLPSSSAASAYAVLAREFDFTSSPLLGLSSPPDPYPPRTLAT